MLNENTLKPLWQWNDEIDRKYDAKGTVRIVRTGSPADRQCQSEGLQLIPGERITDTYGDSNYIIYRKEN